MSDNAKLITTIAFSVSIALGLWINNALSPDFTAILNYAITILASATIYQVLFWILCSAFSNIEWLLKLIWRSSYLQGYWTYSYETDGEKKYGAWIITQTYDSIKKMGFGIDKNTYRKRSDVQSVSKLMSKQNDYEIVNARNDVDENGYLSDVYYYSKTTLHLHERRTWGGIPTYPVRMSGQTEIYGSKLTGNIHKNLVFDKDENAKNETEIISKVIQLIEIDAAKESAILQKTQI